MIWYKVMTNKGWRVFPQSITKDYLTWISSNPQKYEGNLEETREVMIDMPGMVPMHRSWQEVEVQGLKISMPSMDFGFFLADVEEAQLEIGPGGIKCYKIRGWLAGIILTPDIHQELLEKMSEMYPAVELIADQEHAEFMKKFDQLEKSGANVVSGRALALKAQDGKDKKLPN